MFNQSRTFVHHIWWLDVLYGTLEARKPGTVIEIRLFQSHNIVIPGTLWIYVAVGRGFTTVHPMFNATEFPTKSVISYDNLCFSWYVKWITVIDISHYCDVIMSAVASQITSPTIFHSSVYSGAYQKHQSSCPWPLCGEFTGDRWIPRTNGQ